MTVSTNTPRQRFTGNGATVTFAIPFTFSANSEVVVILRSSAGVETVQSYTTHYTIVGSNVVMVTAPATGAYLVIMRSLPYTQLIDLLNAGTYPADTLEGGYDNAIKLVQQLYEILRRVPQIKRTCAAAMLDLEFPEVSAGKVIGWNSAGTALENQTSTTNNVRAAGNQAIGSGVYSVAVTFSSALPDANYAVIPVMKNIVDTIPDIQPLLITAQSASGFTCSWPAATDTANYILGWIAISNN